MTETARHDAWQAGDSYDAYMGRWSRQLAPRFLDWFGAPADLDWLEVGCGTGALSAAILAQAKPRSLLAIDPSASFIEMARAAISDARTEFQVGDAQSLAAPSGSRDAIVSALVLNFVPDRDKALAEMRRVARPGGRVGFYVWDYPGGGLEFVRAFWTAAISLDPAASNQAENTRFAFCTLARLTALAKNAGLATIEGSAIEMPTVFADFEDFWRPFTLGSGRGPDYCMKLEPEARRRLKEKLQESLPRGEGGSIPLKVRAWAIRATVP